MLINEENRATNESRAETLRGPNEAAIARETRTLGAFQVNQTAAFDNTDADFDNRVSRARFPGPRFA